MPAAFFLLCKVGLERLEEGCDWKGEMRCKGGGFHVKGAEMQGRGAVKGPGMQGRGL